MKNPRPFFLLLLLPLLLAGCETLTRHERAVLQAQEVSPYVYNKMMVGDPLTLPDIIELSHRAVPPGIIVDYLERTDARYPLRPGDVTRLRKAGVDEQVISYLLSTSPTYPAPMVYGPDYYSYGPAWYPYGGPYFYGGPEIFIGGGFHGHWHDHGHDWHDHDWHGHDWHGHGGGHHHH